MRILALARLAEPEGAHVKVHSFLQGKRVLWLYIGS